MAIVDGSLRTRATRALLKNKIFDGQKLVKVNIQNLGEGIAIPWIAKSVLRAASFRMNLRNQQFESSSQGIHFVNLLLCSRFQWVDQNGETKRILSDTGLCVFFVLRFLFTFSQL